MTSIREVEVEELVGLVKHIIIDNGDGTFTSMPKATWEELEAQKELGGTL